MERVQRYLIAAVLAHFAVVVAHSAAHFALGILPPPPDALFILSFIVAGPVVALPFLRSHRAAISGLLAFLMSGAFAYGSLNHFVIAGADHVSISAANSWTVVFVASAGILGALESASAALALAIALRALGRDSKTPGPS